MVTVAGALALTAMNFILYHLFGTALTGGKGEPLSRTVFAGFFFYYILFSVVCIPVMLSLRPLHLMSRLWLIIICAVSLVAVARGRKTLLTRIAERMKGLSGHGKAAAFIIILTAAFCTVVLLNYQFTLDASFYVGNVATSLQTDSMNIYDPFTGEWMDHFEMRYFFATFPMNDAVMCHITHSEALIWCKITMSLTALLMSAMTLHTISGKLFGKDMGKRALFLLFAYTADFFMITIYSTSAFLMTRNYEGKCLLGNVVIPGIFYICLELLEDVKSLKSWGLLALLALGAPALSASSNMLVPAMIGVTLVPLAVIRKDFTVVIKSAACMIPGIALTLVYVAYVKGMFVFYTYPR